MNRRKFLQYTAGVLTSAVIVPPLLPAPRRYGLARKGFEGANVVTGRITFGQGVVSEGDYIMVSNTEFLDSGLYVVTDYNPEDGSHGVARAAG